MTSRKNGQGLGDFVIEVKQVFKFKNNYRPFSCLSVLSKVLEKIVCDQVTDFMEKNNLLPKINMSFELDGHHVCTCCRAKRMGRKFVCI